MTFQRIQHTKIAEAIIRQIEELILEGVLRPGDRLPPERELAKTLDVSRPSLREALTSLEERGLLTAHQGGGTFVADVMGPVFSDPILELFGKHDKATADYLEFRLEIESISARLAAERATDADREILTRIFEAMLVAHDLDDPQEEARLDVELHAAIVDASHNIVLIQTLRSIYALLREGVFYNRRRLYENPSGRDTLLEQHRALYECVMAGDGPGAGAAAVNHIHYVASERQLAEVTLSRQDISRRRLEQRQREEAARPSNRKSKRKSA
ncbi:MAG: FCD domain-containing protein [Amylibacter sp.]|nr:FCD domain-containing protein [Amylibacter sp.]